MKVSYSKETSWYVKKRVQTGKRTYRINRPTIKKAACDIGLKVAGAVLMYGVGKFIGEVADHLPYINTLIPQAVDYVADIDVKGNLDNLVGLISGSIGFVNSGVKLDKDLELEKVVFLPFERK